MKSLFKKLFFAIILLIIISVVFGLGFFIGRESQKTFVIEGISNQDLGMPQNVDFSLFWEVWAKAREKFIDSKDMDQQKMIYGAIEGLIKSFGDPYTVFFDPEDSKRFLEDVSGKFEGIGAEIGIRRNILTIIAPLKDSPAEGAGLRAGDKILKIDGKSTLDLSIDEAVNLIRGPKGTKVKLTVAKDDIDVKEITITRDLIEMPSMKLGSIGEGGAVEEFAKIKDGKEDGKENDIAYLSLYQFSPEAYVNLKKSAEEILKSGSRGIVLDLRNNPGGYLETAKDIAGLFLQNNALVAIEEFSDGNRKEYRTRGNPTLLNMPLVVLVNQGSASASEILAAALQINRGVKLVGEKTFGKGSVQEFEELRGGSSLKVTVAKWLTTSGQSINESGIEPDVKVEITDKDYEEKKDPQLEKAVEILKESVKRP